jgi:hypothetical protein
MWDFNKMWKCRQVFIYKSELYNTSRLLKCNSKHKLWAEIQGMLKNRKHFQYIVEKTTKIWSSFAELNISARNLKSRHNVQSLLKYMTKLNWSNAKRNLKLTSIILQISKVYMNMYISYTIWNFASGFDYLSISMRNLKFRHDFI